MEKSARPLIHITGCLGGVETYLLLFLKHYPVKERKIVLVVPEECKIAEEARHLGLTVEVVPMTRSIHPLKDFLALVRVIRVIKRYSRPIVHAHSSKAGLLSRVACAMIPGSSCVYTPHAFYFLGKSGLMRRFFIFVEWLLVPLTTVLAATSEGEAGRAIREVKYPSDRVVTARNGVELMNETKPCAPVGEEFQEKKVVCVGRICFQKNIEMYLRVVAAFTAKHSDVRFRLIGTGFYEGDRNLLNDFLAKYGVSDTSLEIIPWMSREELMTELSTASVAVLTSRYESFGYVLAEATARGVPVVGTNVDGISEVVRDGETGFLVEIDDDMGMVRALERILYTPGELTRMSRNCIRHAEENLSITKHVETLREIYTRLDGR